MQPSEKFIFLEYTNLEIIIPQKAAYSAVFCDTSCLIKDQDGNRKTIFNSQWIPYINIDECVSFIDKTQKKIDIKTCIIIHNHSLYEKEKYFGIVTSSDCKVKEVKFSDFSPFSDYYNKIVKKNGIIACYFDRNSTSKIGYLIDLEKFLFAIKQNGGIL